MAKNQYRQGFQKAQGIVSPKCPKLLSLKDASKLCGLTLWQLRERVWSGNLPYVQFEGTKKIWVDEADLASYLQKEKRVFGS